MTLILHNFAPFMFIRRLGTNLIVIILIRRLLKKSKLKTSLELIWQISYTTINKMYLSM